MKVRYIGARPLEVAPATGAMFTVEPGEIVEVDDKVGRSLLDQPRKFKKVTTTKKDGDA